MGLLDALPSLRLSPDSINFGNVFPQGTGIFLPSLCLTAFPVCVVLGRAVSIFRDADRSSIVSLQVLYLALEVCFPISPRTESCCLLKEQFQSSEILLVFLQ